MPAHAAALPISLWLNLVMLLTTVSILAVPVLAPAIAADLGTPTAFVGVFSGTVWGLSLVTSFSAGTLIGRFGAWRVAQLCLLLSALALFAGATGSLAGLALAAVLAGLGAGAETPASSQLLAHSVPKQQRGTYFSIKQTGVQIGGMGTSALFPLLAGAFGWRTALAIGGLAILAMMVVVEWPRRRHAAYGNVAPAARVEFGVALAELWGSPLLRKLTLGATAFGATQVCLNSFMVSFMVAERRVSLVQAGILLAVAQAGGLVGRLLWGMLATRHGNALALLRGLGAAMALCSLGVGLAGAAAPELLLLPLCFAWGLTASGWNGVFLAEVAHEVPLERVGAITGAIMVVLTVGLVVGPLVFAAIRAAASYGVAYMVLGGVAALGTLLLPTARNVAAAHPGGGKA